MSKKLIAICIITGIIIGMLCGGFIIRVSAQNDLYPIIEDASEKLNWFEELIDLVLTMAKEQETIFNEISVSYDDILDELDEKYHFTEEELAEIRAIEYDVNNVQNKLHEEFDDEVEELMDKQPEF